MKRPMTMEPILRSTEPDHSDVEQAVEADRQWFDVHPGEDEYIREFVPGEFGAAERPRIPAGYRYATLVSVIHRNEQDEADGRFRRLMAICDNRDAILRFTLDP